MGRRKAPDEDKGPPFVRFEKPLFDALLAADFAGVAELKVALAMIRYTIGHRGRGDGNAMGVRFLAGKTDLRTATVHRVLRQLVDCGFARIVGESKGRRPTSYAVVTDPAAWRFNGPRTRLRAPAKAAVSRLSAELAAALRSHGGERTVPMVGNANWPLRSHGAERPCTEELSEDRVLKSEDDAANAEAPSSSSPALDRDDGLSELQRLASASLARFRDDSAALAPTDSEVTP